MSRWWSFRTGLVAAFILQAALVAWLIVDRALLLARGQEVRLAVVPIDPRDLLRGDYVVLSYGISQLDSGKLEGEDTFGLNDTIFVSLRKNGETWEAAALHHAAPAGGTFLKGVVTDTRSGSLCAGECVYRADYDIEKFFVPEGTGRDLEKLRNDQRLTVDVALGSGGRASLKRLMVDGQPRYEEKLF